MGITEWPETNKWIWIDNHPRCRVCQINLNPFTKSADDTLCRYCRDNTGYADYIERLYANGWDNESVRPPSVTLEVDHWKIPCKLEDFRPSEYIYADATISANRRFCKHDYYKKEKIELLL